MSVFSFFFLFFLYLMFNNVQVSFLFFVPFSLSCSFFCFFFLLFFLFFFFIINCSFNVPFFSTLYLPLCLYLNMITIGSLPSLFNFSHKLSLIYNKTFSVAYEHSSSFFFFCTKYPGCFFFPKQPKLLSIHPTTFPNSKQFQIRIYESSPHLVPSKFCASLNYLQNPVSKCLPQ